ncbi:alanine--tRNA ligase-related protein [Kitasatospora sp. NPDC057542]|uniref:alanine--tRNA ligase-related protein n=1 Tax=Kitasatospora sp. NPDC057542 TaxID=3346162 RepID=UPI0036A8EC26
MGAAPASRYWGCLPILGDLAQQSIAGLGLDRLTAILQDVENVCGTDLLMPTFTTVQELAGRDYPGTGSAGGAEKVSFQVVTAHARSIACLIADGVLPAEDGPRAPVRSVREVSRPTPSPSGRTGS